MSDVSRVVYDAALKRAQEARDAWSKQFGGGMIPFDNAYFDALKADKSPVEATRAGAGALLDACVERFTLAALGLDEPPTEAPRDEARLRLGDRVCRHDDGPRRWTLPFCDGCGMLGRRTRESPVCDCGAVSYSEAQVVERAHLSRAEREHAEFVAQVTRRLNDLGVPACPSWPAAFDALDDIMNAARAVVPPPEPPKAPCPGCRGTGMATWAECTCSDCNGSGIDGGTTGGADV